MEDWMKSNVLIIHPGSLYIRVGRATDSTPYRGLHCVGRLRRQGGGMFNQLLQNKSGTWKQRQQQTVHFLYQALRRKRENTEFEGQEQKVRQINFTSHVQACEEPCPAVEPPEVLVGDELLNQDTSEYNLHFPYRAGDLNLDSGIGGSLTSVLADLTTIWRKTVSVGLGIQPEQFSEHRAILIIPAVYNRTHVKHMMDVLLNNLGFCAAFALQEDVAATFGSGNPVACVVDIGEEKTSVSCVEDAVSIPSSRLNLQYGGRLVTQVFIQLSLAEGFPYTPDPASLKDYILLQNIKETACSLDIESSRLSENRFSVSKQRGGRRTESSFNLAHYDEGIVAPMSLFQAELVEYGGPRYLRSMPRDPGDPEDPHDNNYLQETSRKYNKTGDIQGEEGEYDEVDQVEQSDAGLQPALPLDQAILRSIATIQPQDLRRRMLMNILLVGGGSGMTGLPLYLQNKLNAQVVGGVEVIKDTKECGVDWVSWKGGAILATMETAQELWIRKEEWAKVGVKLLRERSIFSWV